MHDKYEKVKTSKFNFGDEYDGKSKYKDTDLYHEIIDELCLQSDDDAVKKKFKNKDKSGIEDKLLKNKIINLSDLEKDEDKFNRLKILKALYMIEKVGYTKKEFNEKKIEDPDISIKEQKILITNILARPSMDNIKTGYSEKSEYGEIIEDLILEVEKEISNKEAKTKKLREINYIWELKINEVFKYVIFDDALHNPDNAMKELNRIENSLKRCLGRFKDWWELNRKYSEPIIDIFYNILLSHRINCYNADYIDINYQIAIEEPPSAEFIEEFNKFDKLDNILVDKEVIDKTKKLLRNCKKDEDIHLLNDTENEYYIVFVLLWLINYCDENISYDKIKELKTAVKFVEVLLEIYHKDKGAPIEEIYIPEFVSAVQEIIYVNKNSERFKNGFYGNKYTNTTLLSTLKDKDKDKADAVMINAWIKKLENRMATNYGVQDLVKKKRDIEILMYKIKSKIFSYQNFDDMVFLNERIFYFIRRSIISEENAKIIGNSFVVEVNKRLPKECKIHYYALLSQKILIDKFQQIIDFEGVYVNLENTYNLFKDFQIYPNSLKIVAEKLSAEIIKKYKEASDKGEFYSVSHIVSNLETNNNRGAYLCFLIDWRKREFYYVSYIGTTSDDIVKRALELKIEYYYRKEI